MSFGGDAASARTTRSLGCAIQNRELCYECLILLYVLILGKVTVPGRAYWKLTAAGTLTALPVLTCPSDI